jgi:hypothetical protein
MKAASAVLAVAAIGLLAAGAASAQSRQAERVSTFAKLPDWTGFWLPDDGVMNQLGLSGHSPGGQADNAKLKLAARPPYTAEFAAQLEAQRKKVSPPTKECGFPFPFVMENPWVFQFLLTPEETVMIWGGREVRHIYTDGRAHPPAEDLWATPWGDSVGHWEGQTLVIDTIAVQPSRFPPALSEQAHFTERLRMVSADRFENELTIEDPVALTAPWKVTIPYVRVTDLDRMVHGLCDENDRNPVVDGKIVIAPPAP